jgi:hypothetical protein
VGAEFTYILLYVRLHIDTDHALSNTLRLFLMACIPGCLAKQAVNVAQLSSSCHAIAKHDAQLANKKKNT